MTPVPLFVSLHPMSMTKRVKWAGDTTNLGRFGIVKKGDLLTLSSSEWNYVRQNRDKRYVIATAEDEKKPNPNLIVIDRSKMGPAEAEEAEAFNVEEKKRIETLANNSRDSAAILVDLQGMTTVELINLNNKLSEGLPQPIVHVGRETTRGELLSALATHYQAAGDEDDEPEAKQEELQGQGKEA